jgi:hypothetical protein
LNSNRELQDQVWEAARDILCSQEAMKAILQPLDIEKVDLTLILQESCVELPLAYELYPRVFEDLLMSTKIHRQTLSQLKNHSSSCIFNIFNIVYRKSEEVESTAALLETLKIVENNSSMMARDDDWRQSLSETVLWCLTSFERSQVSSGKLKNSYSSLNADDRPS